MPASPEPPPPNPFAAELRRAAAGAAAPDKVPSLRELSSISGMGRTAIGDWLSGKSLPRSWDDSAVLVVDAIIKLAAQYGKRFADEDAVRQRCKDAYDRARNVPQVNNIPGGGALVPEIGMIAIPVETASRRTATDDRTEPPELEPEIASARRWRPKNTTAIFAALAVAAVILILLLYPMLRTELAKAASGCLSKSSVTPSGAGKIHVCAHDGRGSYSVSTRTTDTQWTGHCLRWRIVWDNNLDTYTPAVCPQSTSDFDSDAPAGVSGVRDAFLENYSGP